LSYFKINSPIQYLIVGKTVVKTASNLNIETKMQQRNAKYENAPNAAVIG